MKQLLLSVAMLSAVTLSAQDTTGILTYEQTIATRIQADNIPEGLRDMIPDEQKTAMELLFSPMASLYQIKENASTGNTQEYKEENTQIRIETKVPENKYYTDLTTQKVTEQRDFMGRIFLINHDLNASKWKFTGRQKKILDMPCSEAVSVSDSVTTVVWYTTAIPVSLGPETFSGLPGMVLEVSAGTDMHIIATKLEPLGKDALKKIKAPVKGKKVDEATFLKIVTEKQEALQKQYGGNGNVIIMRQSR